MEFAGALSHVVFGGVAGVGVFAVDFIGLGGRRFLLELAEFGGQGLDHFGEVGFSVKVRLQN